MATTPAVNQQTSNLPAGFTLDQQTSQTPRPTTQPGTTVSGLPSGFALDTPTSDSNGGALGHAALGALDAASKAHDELNPPSFASTLPAMRIEPAPKSTGVMNNIENWFRDAADDVKFGTGKTEFGRILKTMGAQPLANETTEGERAAMPTSIITGALHTAEGAAQLAQHEKRLAGLETAIKGLLEASTVPAQFVGGSEIGETPLLEKGLDTGAEIAGKTTDKIADTARAVLKGGKVAQEPAQQAVREATGMGEGSLRTGLEDSISNVKSAAKNLYKQFDDATGADYGDLKDQLSDIESKIRRNADPDIEQKLIAKKIDITNAMDRAKATAETAGVDVKSLDQADKLFTRYHALSDLQNNLRQVISGNTEQGAAESVNLNSLIKRLEKMDANTKYGASRLEQALGSRANADKLLQDLYAAKQAGQSAMKIQKVAKTIGKYIAYGTLIGMGAHAVHSLGE